jgi:hypothetical protein
METTLREQLTTIVTANRTPLRSTTPRAVVIAELGNRIEKLETAVRILAAEVEQLGQRSDQATPSLLDPSISRRFRRSGNRRAVPPA